MSAAVLRGAASLMRERAEAAADAPWVYREEVAELPRLPEHTYVRYSVYAHDGFDNDGFDNDGTPYVAEANNKPDAEHIASWHPAVALAVADWLDDEAFMHDNGRPMVSVALDVARAYLGSDQ